MKFSGFLGLAVGGCGPSENSKGACDLEEKAWCDAGYTFQDVYDTSTSLLTTLDGKTACAQVPDISVNGDPSLNAECISLYRKLQENVPSFAPDTTHVGTDTLQVYTIGDKSGHYIGTSFSLFFEDEQEGTYLETRLASIEDGCTPDEHFFYAVHMCYSLSYEESRYGDEDAFLTCNHYMPALVIFAELDTCPVLTSVALDMYTLDASFEQDTLFDDALLRHFQESAATIQDFMEEAEK